MQTSQKVEPEVQLILDSLGGEPLDGSGFETESCDSDFTSQEEQ
jgi:hypothetical protein